MADKITVKLEGVEKCIKNLKKYQMIKREACKTVLKEVGFKVEGDGKKGCPVDTGRLRSSLSTNWSGNKRPYGRVGTKAFANDGVKRPPGPDGLTVVVGTNVPYAFIQEFGYWPSDMPYPKSGAKIPQKGRNKESQPRPEDGFRYLTTAFKKNKPEVEKRIKKIFKKKETL